MRWLDKLERKYGKYAVHNLMQYIVGGMAIVFIFNLMNNGAAALLGFSPKLIASGQVWRLVTFVFVPRTYSPIWIIFSLMIMFFYGRVLEQSWGAFKFNMYYIIGTVGTVVSSFIVEFVTGGIYPVNNYYLYMTLLLAVAQVIPDYEIRIYFILPVKLKYLGYVYGGILLLEFLSGGFATKITILFSTANFLIFFGPGIYKKLKRLLQKKKYQQGNKPIPKNAVRRRSSSNGKAKNGQVIQVAFHCCEVCGKTEVDDPNLEFRYCSKCDGRHEYCTDHIFNHEHITKD